jgi:hypothetical protein
MALKRLLCLGMSGLLHSLLAVINMTGLRTVKKPDGPRYLHLGLGREDGATGSVGANRTTSRRIPPLKGLSSPFEEPIFSSGPQRDVVTW